MTAEPRSRSSYRPLIALALAAVVGAHALGACTTRCDSGVCSDVTEPRLLDRTCRLSFAEGPACVAGEGAVKSTGITADTVGFHLGDAGGTLTFHLAALAGVGAGDTFDVEILAASTSAEGSDLRANLTWGSCADGCPKDPNTFVVRDITPEYSWFQVIVGATSALNTSLPYDAVLTLDGKSIDIADIRTSSNFPEGACSIAGPVGARHVTRGR